MKNSKAGRIGILLSAILTLVAISVPGTAAAKDRNKDRIPDKWEQTHRLSLKKDQRKLDQDRDGLRNRGEWRAGTDPRDKDSDGDGTKDGKENAGFVSAYDAEAGTLTLTLYGGGDISGAVTDDTRVKCEAPSGDDSEEPPAEEPESRHGGQGHLEEDGSDERPEGEGHGYGHDHHGEGHRGDCGGDCSLEDIAVGVEVREAEVKYTSVGPVFKSIEIEKAASEDEEVTG